MNIKLSELKNDDRLVVDIGTYYLVISKENYIRNIKKFEGKEVFTTKQYKASINAKDMLEKAIDYEASNMYKGWKYDIWDNITEEDINELQNVINKIFDKIGKYINTAYSADKKVEIDYLILNKE